MTAFLSLLAVAAVEQADHSDSVASFAMARRRDQTVIEVVVTSHDAPSPDEDFFYRFHATRGTGTDPSVRLEADSRSCRRAKRVFQERETIAMPVISLDPDADILGMLDGDGYSLTTDAYYGADRMHGEVTLQSSNGTGLAAWVERMLSVLEPCWRVADPPARS